MKHPTRLNKKAIEQFYEEGYTLVPDVFDSIELDAVSNAFDRLVEKASELPGTCMFENSQFVIDPIQPDSDADLRIHRIVWCGGTEPELERLGRSTAIIEMAADILGDQEVVQLINQAHFKLPGDGVRFDWHQDCLHRRYGTDEWNDVNGRGSFVQVVLAIDPMTDDNGPLEVVPYSCQQGPIPVDPETRSLPPGSFDPNESRAVTMPPGSALLLGPYVIHGSGPNESSGPRRVFINGFASPGANSRLYPGCGTGHTVRLC